MTQQSLASITSTIAGRYALALFELAHETKSSEAISKDMLKLDEIIQNNNEIAQLIKNPLFKAIDQIEILKKIAQKAKFSQITTNFLCLVAKKRRLFYIKNMIKIFFDIGQYRSGQRIVEITSFQKLNESQINNITKVLKNKIGQNSKVATKINEKIMGGLIVKYDSYMIDMSVIGKLDKLRYWMKEMV